MWMPCPVMHVLYVCYAKGSTALEGDSKNWYQCLGDLLAEIPGYAWKKFSMQRCRQFF